MDLDVSNPNIESVTEIWRDRLYFVVLKSPMKLLNYNSIYINTDEEFQYLNYYNDFGPLNISCLYKYCCKVSNLLHQNPAKQIVHCTTTKFDKKVNAAFLLGSFAIIHFKLSPKYVSQLFSQTCHDLRPFNDASQCNSTWKLTVYDCFFAIYKTHRLGFFHIDDFHVLEYDTYSKLKNGDLTWLLPNKFLAFIGPMDYYRFHYCHPPEFYINYFIENDVTDVIRLNNKLYDKAVYESVGIRHHDLFFPDGTTPPRRILVEFLNICESAQGAIAVHCKAGLGRTGTLIAAYIIKHYRLRAREAIAWLRICRPGSVIGPQQNWLECIESVLWESGNKYRAMHFGDSEKCIFHRYGIYTCIKNNGRINQEKQKALLQKYFLSEKEPLSFRNDKNDTLSTEFWTQENKKPSKLFQKLFSSGHLTQGDKLNSVKAQWNK